MFGFRRSTKRPQRLKRPKRLVDRWRRFLGHRFWRPALRGAAVLISVGGLAWGVGRLDAHIRKQPAFQLAPRLVFSDAPEGLIEPLTKIAAPAAEGPWIDDRLCAQIGRALKASGWVKRVRSVRRLADATVAISCEYRVGAALVQTRGAFYLVDAEGVRLPGTYAYDPSYILVQGARGPLPEPGQPWAGGDLAAGLAVVGLLRDEPFFEQISGVVVDNYQGRRHLHDAHIELVAAPPGGRIMWGSAPGEEIEENSVLEKISLLRANYIRWGRIDAGHQMIDISTFPDRISVLQAGSGGGPGQISMDSPE